MFGLFLINGHEKLTTKATEFLRSDAMTPARIFSAAQRGQAISRGSAESPAGEEKTDKPRGRDWGRRCSLAHVRRQRTSDGRERQVDLVRETTHPDGCGERDYRHHQGVQRGDELLDFQRGDPDDVLGYGACRSTVPGQFANSKLRARKAN
jgi:hypothetical protein